MADKIGTNHPSTLASNKAKNVAVKWIKDNHPDVWAKIPGDERERLGIPREPGITNTYQKEKIEELQAEVAKLREALARIASAPTAPRRWPEEPF